MSWEVTRMSSNGLLQCLTTEQQGNREEHTGSLINTLPRGGWRQVMLFVFIVIIRLVAS